MFPKLINERHENKDEKKKNSFESEKKSKDFFKFYFWLNKYNLKFKKNLGTDNFF